MKKTWVAFMTAVAATSVSAQSSVTLFGVVDLALSYGAMIGPGGNTAQLVSGANSNSKLGFRGREDLGGGLSASFWLEGQLYADNGSAGREGLATNQGITSVRGSGLSFTRRSTVSLSSDWGELRLGRDFTPSQYAFILYDPFGNVGVGASMLPVGASSGLNAGPAFNLVPTGQGTSGPITRVSNEISYFLPQKIGGLYGQASYWLGENAKNGNPNESDGTGAGVRLGYASGPLDVSGGWSKTRYRATPVATTTGAASGDFVAWHVGTAWDFGIVKLSANYGRDERQSLLPVRGNGWLVGLNAPIGVGEIKASVSNYQIDAGPGNDPSARLYALGYVHNLSKRTAVYNHRCPGLQSQRLAHHAWWCNRRGRFFQVKIKWLKRWYPPQLLRPLRIASLPALARH